METSVYNVRDLPEFERSAGERIVRHPLAEDQQLVIVVRSSPPPPGQDTTVPRLPAWCNVYEGLNDDEIFDLEKVALTRADLTRHIAVSTN